VRNLSAAARAAIFNQETDKVFIPLITISSSEIGTPIRLARNTENVTSLGAVYVAAGFNIALPASTDEVAIKTVVLTMDTVDLTIIQALRALTIPPTITLSIVIHDSPDTVEIGPLTFSAGPAQYNREALSWTLTYEDRLSVNLDAVSFSPSDFWAVH
jgi:hypothetical protein